MTARETEEYRALRDTIRERGTARAHVVVLGFFAWAGLALAGVAAGTLPLTSLLPLLVLAIAFEAVYALHTGVERVGRYLQVYFEDEGGWEHTAMAYGQRFGGAGPDPLFRVPFWLATALNFVMVPALVADLVPAEWAVVGAAHAVFAVRVAAAARRAARQRAEDLDRFRQLRQPQT